MYFIRYVLIISVLSVYDTQNVDIAECVQCGGIMTVKCEVKKVEGFLVPVLPEAKPCLSYSSPNVIDFLEKYTKGNVSLYKTMKINEESDCFFHHIADEIYDPKKPPSIHGNYFSGCAAKPLFDCLMSLDEQLSFKLNATKKEIENSCKFIRFDEDDKKSSISSTGSPPSIKDTTGKCKQCGGITGPKCRLVYDNSSSGYEIDMPREACPQHSSTNILDYVEKVTKGNAAIYKLEKLTKEYSHCVRFNIEDGVYNPNITQSNGNVIAGCIHPDLWKCLFTIINNFTTKLERQQVFPMCSKLVFFNSAKTKTVNLLFFSSLALLIPHFQINI